MPADGSARSTSRGSLTSVVSRAGGVVPRLPRHRDRDATRLVSDSAIAFSRDRYLSDFTRELREPRIVLLAALPAEGSANQLSYEAFRIPGCSVSVVPAPKDMSPYATTRMELPYTLPISPSADTE